MSGEEVLSPSEVETSTSDALQELDMLVEAGALSSEACNTNSMQLQLLRDALLAALGREQALGAAAAEAKSRSYAAETDAEVLKSDLESITIEGRVIEARVEELEAQVRELHSHHTYFGKRVDQMQAEHAAAVYPVVRRLEEDLRSLLKSRENEKARVKSTTGDLAAANVHEKQVNEEKVALEAARVREEAELKAVDSLPEKWRRQVDMVRVSFKDTQRQAGDLEARLRDKAAEEQRQEDALDALEAQHEVLSTQLERARIMAEGKARNAEDIKGDVEKARLENDRIGADSADLDVQLAGLGDQLKAQRDSLNRAKHELSVQLKRYRNADACLRGVQEQMPSLTAQEHNVTREMAALRREIVEEKRRIADLRKEVDIGMSGFLVEEVVGKEKAAQAALSREEVRALELEVEEAAHAEKRRMAALSHLTAVREKLSKQVNTKQNKLKEALGDAQMRDGELRDMQSQARAVRHRTRDFAKLHDLVKGQKNKFVNLVQAAGHSLAEMKDKLCVLDNEASVLMADSTNKIKLMRQTKQKSAAALADRDALKLELMKLGATYRAKQDLLEEQSREMESVTVIINRTERDMGGFRRKYLRGMEMRNQMGLQLVDRNDELCGLYEREHLQQRSLNDGNMQLKRREDTVRLLKLEVQELTRCVAATAKFTPIVPQLDDDVVRLQKAVLQARRRVNELELEMENPDNSNRCRMLPGKIPDREEMLARVHQLKERIATKGEQILEKEVIARELGSLLDRCQQYASANRDGAFDLARAVVEYKQRYRAATRKIMALVSELSMYQATALKLNAEKAEIEAAVLEARARLEAGQPPTAEAARDWERLQRERDVVVEMHAQQEAITQILEQKGTDLRTTAAQRPNAYIPDDMGIPKPYFGGLLPFKPSDAGSTMRHIRNPKPREIEI